MQKILFLIIILILISVPSYCQKKEYHIKCFLDSDSIKDLIVIKKNLTKDYCKVFFFLGNNKAMSVDVVNNSSSFLGILPIPKGIIIKDLSVMEKLSQYVFGIPYNVMLVPEVQWISEILNNKNNQIKNPRIDFQSTFSIKWTKGKVDNVKGNVTLIDSLQGRRFSNSLNNDLFESKKYSRYFVSYYANNQGKITCDSLSTPIVCSSKHGVILKRGNFYSWIFINENTIFGIGSEKLRWPSLSKVNFTNGFAIIRIQSSLTDASVLYVIDTRTGKLVRINNKFYNLNRIEDYDVDRSGTEILIKNGETQIHILIKDLFK